jgi:serine/threonine protein kinase
MGDVYLAHDLVLDRAGGDQVRPHLDAGRASGSSIEARAAARIQHPNVMAIHRVGELDGHPYLISEYIRGKSLAELPLPVPVPQALRSPSGSRAGWRRRTARACCTATSSSANAILDEDGVVKLLDFSLAKLIDAPRRLRVFGGTR